MNTPAITAAGLLAAAAALTLQAAGPRLPGTRPVIVPPAELPNPFVGPPLEITSSSQPAETPGLADLRAFLAHRPVTALAWAEDERRRSVLLGADVILRLGGRIPQDLLTVGPDFYVSRIDPDGIEFTPVGRPDQPLRLRFRARAELRIEPRGPSSSPP